MVHAEQSKPCSHPQAVAAQPRSCQLQHPVADLEPSLPHSPGLSPEQAQSRQLHLGVSPECDDVAPPPRDCWPNPSPLAGITAVAASRASLPLPLSCCPTQRPLRVSISCASPLLESLRRLPRSHFESDTNGLPCRQGPSDHLCHTSHQPPPCPPDCSALPSPPSLSSPPASDHSCILFPSWGLCTCSSSDRNVLLNLARTIPPRSDLGSQSPPQRCSP